MPSKNKTKMRKRQTGNKRRTGGWIPSKSSSANSQSKNATTRRINKKRATSRH